MVRKYYHTAANSTFFISSFPSYQKKTIQRQNLHPLLPANLFISSFLSEIDEIHLFTKSIMSKYCKESHIQDLTNCCRAWWDISKWETIFGGAHDLRLIVLIPTRDLKMSGILSAPSPIFLIPAQNALRHPFSVCRCGTIKRYILCGMYLWHHTTLHTHIQDGRHILRDTLLHPVGLVSRVGTTIDQQSLGTPPHSTN